MEKENPIETDENLFKTPAASFDEEMVSTSHEPAVAAENSKSSCDSIHPEEGDLPLVHSTTGSEELKLKPGQIVIYTDKETGQKYTGKITSRAGKASGKHRNWYNLEYREPEEMAGSTGSADTGQVTDLEVTPSENDKSYTDNRDEILVVEEDIFSQAKQT
ncbi:hypothetical protein GOODEAATRI_012369 [Goodea atripinnis]|uniref:Uncharacterized protein n=1 Tax=Goodea atripinnis TaxID=208336 RepID=A0ABV0NJL0_9TELE